MTTATAIQTVAPFVLTTDRDARTYKSVTSILTDRDALAIVSRMTSQFAQDLTGYARRNQLTHNRRVWVHALANEQFARQQAPAAVAAPAPRRAALAGIAAMFATAKANAAKKGNKGTRLKVRLSVDGQGIAVKFASANGRNAGFLYVTDGGDYENGTYFGKISPDGEFFPSRDCTDRVKSLLTAFDADPVTFAREFGQRTNQCCFCGRLLTDDKAGRSVEVGYGPICADTYGLPWG